MLSLGAKRASIAPSRPLWPAMLATCCASAPRANLAVAGSMQLSGLRHAAAVLPLHACTKHACPLGAGYSLTGSSSTPPTHACSAHPTRHRPPAPPHCTHAAGAVGHRHILLLALHLQHHPGHKRCLPVSSAWLPAGPLHPCPLRMLCMAGSATASRPSGPREGARPHPLRPATAPGPMQLAVAALLLPGRCHPAVGERRVSSGPARLCCIPPCTPPCIPPRSILFIWPPLRLLG